MRTESKASSKRKGGRVASKMREIEFKRWGNTTDPFGGPDL